MCSLSAPVVLFSILTITQKCCTSVEASTTRRGDQSQSLSSFASTDLLSPWYGDHVTASDGGGYPSYPASAGCDCGSYEILGVLSGGTALAALGVFVLSQMQDENKKERKSLMSAPSLMLKEKLENMFPAETLAESVTNATCYFNSWMAAEKGRTAGRSSILSSAVLFQSGCECATATVGAAAGFAAIAGLIAYALQQGASAADGSRSLGSGHGMAENGTMLGMDSLWSVLEHRRACLPYVICEVNRRARDISRNTFTVTRLASLPLAWFLSESGSSRNDFSDICSALQASEGEHPCLDQQALCRGPVKNAPGGL